MNTINPAWQTKFEVSYKFESRQMLKFDVYDRDSKSVKIQDHDFLGSCECSLEEVVSAQGRGLTRRVVGVGSTRPSTNNTKQSITIVAEEILASREVLKLNLRFMEPCIDS